MPKIQKMIKASMDKVEQLQAENKQLRAVLKSLLDDLDTIGVSDDPFILPAITDARAALARAERGGE